MTAFAAVGALALPASAAATHGYAHYKSQWGSVGSAQGQFNSPGGLDTDSHDNVYVADFGNHRIQKFNSDGDFITQWGTLGTGNGQFNEPIDVAVHDDGAGNVAVYVTERTGNRVQKFSSSGSYVTKWAAPARYPGSSPALTALRRTLPATST